MLRIKLRRKGKKHEPHFRLVVMEKRSKLQGRFVDDLGWINPHEKKQEIQGDKVQEWMEKGAQPTDTVYNILIRAGILKGKKRPVHKKKKVEEGEGEEKAPEKKEEASTDTDTEEKTPDTPTKESTEEPKVKEDTDDKEEVKEEKPQSTTEEDGEKKKEE